MKYLILILFLVSCTSDNQQSITGNPATCNIQSNSTYTVSWGAILDPDLSNYSIYYTINNSSITKLNSTKVIVNSTSWVLDPRVINALTCNIIYIGVTASGITKSESSLSNIVTQVID